MRRRGLAAVPVLLATLALGRAVVRLGKRVKIKPLQR